MVFMCLITNIVFIGYLNKIYNMKKTLKTLIHFHLRYLKNSLFFYDE